jgi:hypothetical protein
VIYYQRDNVVVTNMSCEEFLVSIQPTVLDRREALAWIEREKREQEIKAAKELRSGHHRRR